MKASVQLEGMDEVRAVFATMLPREARKLMQQTMLGMAEHMVDIATGYMPIKSGRMQRGTRAKAERTRGNLASSTVLCSAFYWHFVEHGDGPDGVEHAMFLRARERTMADAKSSFYPAFNRGLDRIFGL